MTYQIILEPSLKIAIHQESECSNPHHHRYSCPPFLKLYLRGQRHFYTVIAIIRDQTVISGCLRVNTEPCPILPYMITTKHSPCLIQFCLLSLVNKYIWYVPLIRPLMPIASDHVPPSRFPSYILDSTAAAKPFCSPLPTTFSSSSKLS